MLSLGRLPCRRPPAACNAVAIPPADSTSYAQVSYSSVEPERATLVEVVPLGGVGQFGMNMMAVTASDTTLLLDAGAMFPGLDHFGVDLAVPDLSFLEQTDRQVTAVVLTHGHEDHIGAIPYIWDRIDGPIYGTPLTLALLGSKLDAHGIDPSGRLIAIAPRERVTAGAVEIEFLRVTHSMPDCVAVALRTPAGTIVHTGDFKFDDDPLDGEPPDTRRLAELGDEGVLALFADSTNVAQAGHAGSEQDVVGAFEEIFARTRGKLIVAAFSSSIYRVQILVSLAVRFGRKVALVGRGMRRTAELAERLGHLNIPPAARIRDRDVNRQGADQVLCVVTGSQGEPLAALSRIAADAHPHVTIDPGDVVVFSARAIPGNQRAIGRLKNDIARRGAEIVDDSILPVHVSGHACEEDLKRMLALVRPRCFVPIHGEYRFLARHAQVAGEAMNGQTAVLVVENGDRIGFDAAGGWVKDSVPAGGVLIDSAHSGEVGTAVLRERRQLAAGGVVVLVIPLGPRGAASAGSPAVTTSGFVLDKEADAVLAEAPALARRMIEDAPDDERRDRATLRERVRAGLAREFRKRTGRNPLVLPVIVET